MRQHVEQQLVEKWLRGWSLSRRLPLPVPYKSGFKVTVGYADQQERYVFPAFNADVRALATDISDPHIFLKICNAPTDLGMLLPARWTIQPQAYMMSCEGKQQEARIQLPEGYTWETEVYPGTHKLDIICRNTREVAASGRVVQVEDMAIFDRISTTAGHRRKGLATQLMLALQQIALKQGICRHILVATAEGRLLYESMDWRVYCPYTSVVIPGDN